MILLVFDDGQMGCHRRRMPGRVNISTYFPCMCRRRLTQRQHIICLFDMKIYKKKCKRDSIGKRNIIVIAAACILKSHPHFTNKKRVDWGAGGRRQHRITFTRYQRRLSFASANPFHALSLWMSGTCAWVYGCSQSCSLCMSVCLCSYSNGFVARVFIKIYWVW